MKWIGQHIWDLTSRFRSIAIFEKAIKLLKSDGSDGGTISMTGSDMVLSNTAGDVLVGSTTYQIGGDQDIFIGDGTNSVDLIFEQPGSIRGYDSSVNLTIGGGGGVITFADAVEFTSDVTVSSLNYASSRGWVEDSQPMSNQAGFYGGNFVLNGADSENETVWGLDPFGNKGLLWKAIQGSTDDNGDGGWNKDIRIPANNNVGYISYVYFKIDFTPDSSDDGSFYHGCGQNAGETLSLGGTSQTNPYFNSGAANGLGFGGAPIEANKWYVSVGIIQAYNNSTTDMETVSGIYEVDTGKKIRGGTEYKMGNNTTGQRHRTYWYYSTTSDVQNAYFWGPGFHAIDGTEPKIQDLVRSASFSSSYQAGRDAQNFIDFTTDNVIKFTTNSSEALRIDSSGRVGINTTSPSSDLEVVSSGANGIVLGEDAGNSTLSSRLFFANATSGQGVTLLNGGGGLVFFTGATPGGSSGTERIKMASNGSLGIGTSSPSQKLHVVGDTLLDGDLTVNGINYGLYHSTTEDGYYSESYEGTKHLTMFIKNARADIIRYASVGSLEYWNGSSWVDGSAEIANLKNLLDGRQDTRWNVPSTYYKFRFSVYPSTAWPTRAKIGMQMGWTGSTWPGATMLVEEYDGSNWATKVTADFGGQAGGSATPLNSNDNDVDNWGLMFKSDTALHTGNGNNTSYNSGLNTRITIDFYGWSPSNSSYVTIPLQNIFITSNYAGTENTDYTNLLDYDRDVTIPNDMNVSGTITLSGDAEHQILRHTLSTHGLSSGQTTSVFGRNVFLNAYDDVILRAGSSDEIRMFAGDDSAARMTIDQNGNVGIGTTSPTERLTIEETSAGADVYPLQLSNVSTTDSTGVGIIFNVSSNTGYDNARILVERTDSDATGEMSFWTVSGNSGTISERMRIDKDGNVGIGTTSPTAPLHIETADDAVIRLTSTDNKAYIALSDNDTNGYISSENGKLSLGANTGVNANNLNIDLSNNNVGIGTSSPSANLEIGSDGAGEKTLKIHSDTANSYFEIESLGNIARLKATNNTNLMLRSDGGGGYITNWTNGAERMRIDSSGNVGIGQTSPAHKLDVAGYIRSANTGADSTTKYSGFFGRHYTNSEEDVMAISTESTSSNNNIYIGGGFGTRNSATTIRFSTAANSTTTTGSERMRIDAAGNVGIGTTSPSTKLEVAGDLTVSGTAPTIRIQDSRNLNNPDWDSVSLGNIEFYTSDTTSPGARVLAEIEAFSNNAAASGPNADLIFKTSAIADSSPQTRLTIGYEGTSTFTGNVTVGPKSNATVSVSENGGADVKIRAGSVGRVGTYSNHNFVITQNGSDALTIDTSRRVGIGTSSPNALLEVGGNVRFGDSTTGVAFGISSTDVYQISGADNGFSGWNSLHFKADGNDGLFIEKDTNNVGIGTTSPSEKLEVSGKILATGGQIRAGSYLESYPSFSFANDIDTGMFSDTADQLEFVTGGSSRVTINSSGSVGIGTDNPGKLLDVNGTFRASGEAFFLGAIDVTAGTNSRFRDGVALNFNTNRTARIFSDSNDLIIQQGEDDKDIIFRSDDGSGGLATYFQLDGSLADGSNYYTKWPDNSIASFGSAPDLLIYHDGFNSRIRQLTTSNLIIENLGDDKDIIFKSDDGSGGVTEYFRLDGGLAGGDGAGTTFTIFPDNARVGIGNNADLRLFHNATDSVIQNIAGDLYIQNSADDKDILFRCDDGSGGMTAYLTLDGSATRTNVHKNMLFDDSVTLGIGSSYDLQLYHNGGTSLISNQNGNLLIRNQADDSDIIFQADDGSGGETEYFRVDGGDEKVIFSKDVEVTGDLTVNGDSVQTKQMVVTTHNFQMANTTGTFFYVPFNNLNESSAATSTEYWARSIAPYAGTIKKVIVRSHTSLGSSCQIRVSKITDTTDDLPSGTHVTNTGIDISTANTSVSTTMSTNTFAEGDVVGVALNRSAGSSARVVVTIVWEYTV